MRVKLLTVMTITFLLLVGCNSKDSSGVNSSQVGEKTSIRFACNSGYVAEFEKRIEEFNKIYPDINVDVIGIAASSWGEMLNTVAMDIYAGQGPDIADIASEGMYAFARSGLLEPIEEYIDRDMSELAATYNEIPSKLKDAHVIDGHTYSLPTVWNNMAIYYNKKVLADAGLSAPQAGWTINEFINMAETITKNNTGGKNDIYAYAFFQNYFTTLEPWLQAFNASTLNDDWTGDGLNNENGKSAYKFLYDLVKTEKYAPAMGTDDFSLFVQNKLAFMGSGMWYVEKLKNNGFEADDYDIVPFPSIDGSVHSVIGVGGAPIFKASKNKEAAWKLSKFLSSKDFQEQFLSTNIWAIPSSKSAADAVFAKPFFPTNAEVFWDAVTYGKYVPAPESYTTIESSVLRNFGAYMAGAKTVDKAIVDTASDIEKAING